MATRRNSLASISRSAPRTANSRSARCCKGSVAHFRARSRRSTNSSEALATLTREVTQYGVFNFLMSNGQALFSHCSTHLYYLVRSWPFSTAHLIDADMSIDFAKYTTPEDRVAVIATSPLTDNEVWTRFAPGDLAMFQQGALARTLNIPVPEAVAKAAEPLAKACVGSALKIDEIRTTAAVESELGIE